MNNLDKADYKSLVTFLLQKCQQLAVSCNLIPLLKLLICYIKGFFTHFMYVQYMYCVNSRKTPEDGEDIKGSPIICIKPVSLHVPAATTGS